MSIAYDNLIKSDDIEEIDSYEINIRANSIVAGDNSERYLGYTKGPSIYRKNPSLSKQTYKISATPYYSSGAFYGWQASGDAVTDGNAYVSTDNNFLVINNEAEGDISLLACFHSTASVTLAGNPVFYSLSGDLFTDSSLTSPVSTNVLYSQSTFYRRPGDTISGEYIYSIGTGAPYRLNSNLSSVHTYYVNTSISFLQSRYSDGTLKTLFGTTGTVWSDYFKARRESDDGGSYYVPISRYLNLNNGSYTEVDDGYTTRRNRCVHATFSVSD